MNPSAWLTLALVAVAVLLAVSVYGEDRPPLLPAKQDNDQSLMAGLGFHHNGGNGQAAILVYRHPLAHHLNMYFAIDRVKVEDKPDRTELLLGIQIFPLDVPFYIIMGAGASKTSTGEDSLVTTGAGYQWTLNPSWFVDTTIEVDMEFDGSTRWAGIIGLGKRF